MDIFWNTICCMAKHVLFILRKTLVTIHLPKGVNITVAPIKNPRNRASIRRQSLVHSVNHHKANTITPNNKPSPALINIHPVKKCCESVNNNANI